MSPSFNERSYASNKKPNVLLIMTDQHRADALGCMGNRSVLTPNLDRLRGLVFSQQVLLALTQAGMSREDAYLAVQRNAMTVWEEGKSFLELLKGDRKVMACLGADALEDLFDMGHHTKHVETIFRRVFGDA